MRKSLEDTVIVRRRFNVSADQVFDAWIDPVRASRSLFTKPGKQRIVRAELDVRVGGKFLFVAQRDGRDIEHIGEYLEISRPRRLVFTLCVPTVWKEFNTVTLEITPLASGCEITLTHQGVLPEHEAPIFEGWTIFINLLQSIGEVKEQSCGHHLESN